MKRLSLKAGTAVHKNIEHATLSILIFTVNATEYAFPVKSIQEIINCDGYSELPANTGSSHGVVGLRGVGVPVFDFNTMLSGTRTNISKRSCIVIIDAGEISGSGKSHNLGLLVDTVSVVLEIEKTRIEDAPRAGDKSSISVFDTMIQKDGKFVLILNEMKLLSSFELKDKNSVNTNLASESV